MYDGQSLNFVWNDWDAAASAAASNAARTAAKKLRDVLQRVRHNVEEECLLAFSATSATDERCQIAVGHGANERNAGGDIGYCTRRSPKPSRHARGGGPTIKLVVQLAQSPDTNGCDLGLFRSVDTRYAHSEVPAIRIRRLCKDGQQGSPAVPG